MTAAGSWSPATPWTWLCLWSWPCPPLFAVALSVGSSNPLSRALLGAAWLSFPLLPPPPPPAPTPADVPSSSAGLSRGLGGASAPGAHWGWFAGSPTCGARGGTCGLAADGPTTDSPAANDSAILPAAISWPIFPAGLQRHSFLRQVRQPLDPRLPPPMLLPPPPLQLPPPPRHCSTPKPLPTSPRPYTKSEEALGAEGGHRRIRGGVGARGKGQGEGGKHVHD